MKYFTTRAFDGSPKSGTVFRGGFVHRENEVLPRSSTIRCPPGEAMCTARRNTPQDVSDENVTVETQRSC